MGSVTIGNIYRYPVPCLFNIQSPLWPVHGCQITQLTLFTFSDDGFHSSLRDPRGNLFHKIKCSPHTRMTALSVNNLDLVKPNWTHRRSAGRLHRPSVPFNCIKPPSQGTLVNRSALFWLDLTKDTFIHNEYSFTSFIIVSSRRWMSISLVALYKQHASSERACVNAYAEGLAIDEPYAPHQVFLVHSGTIYQPLRSGRIWHKVNF